MKDDKPNLWRNLLYFCLPIIGAWITAPFFFLSPFLTIAIGSLALIEIRLSDSRRDKNAAMCAFVSSMLVGFYILAFMFGGGY